ncbi:hypothetical protein EMIT0P4_60084 [Pseudomonas sp. IT-P4]
MLLSEAYIFQRRPEKAHGHFPGLEQVECQRLSVLGHLETAQKSVSMLIILSRRNSDDVSSVHKKRRIYAPSI